jgi:hypothetical protein
MKIIIPYDADTFFSPDQHHVLQLLRLEDWQVLDQILDSWTLFMAGSTEEIYEITVDAYNDLMEGLHQGSDEGQRLQALLAEHDNEFVELMCQAAIRLQYLLQGLPEYAREKTYETGEYHFLKIEDINRAGKFAVISTDVRENMC